MALLDSGNFTGNPSDAGRAKTAALIEGMQRLEYGAVNVGEREVRLGWQAFEQTTDGATLPFVSANIVREADGEPVFPPRRVVEARSADGEASRRLGVIGVARYNPLFKKDGPDGGPIVIVRPEEPVRAQVAALRAEGVELIVLLTALHKEDAKRLVQAVPGIDYVLGSYGGAYTTRSEVVGDTRLLYCGNRGQRLTEARVFLDEQGGVLREQSRMHFLTAHYPADRPMMAFVDEALATLAGAAPAAAAAAGR